MRLPTLPPVDQLVVRRVGVGRYPSPLAAIGQRLVSDVDRVLVSVSAAETEALVAAGRPLPSFELAGPRPRLAFDPATATAGIVTCGGLCPGLNDVIRSITMTLRRLYGVPDVLGFRYGYRGLTREGHGPMELSTDAVDDIHRHGGTVLGSSRGPQDPTEVVDTLVAAGVDMLFCVGGDGTLRGAHAIATEIGRRGLAIAVVGVPKTIDNDLRYIERSFGFATAVEEAGRIITGAHEEARGAWNGVGLVKLMGRHAGFIAAHASLANSDVNLCVVPEVPFTVDGLIAALRRRLAHRHHAVIVVAEGAGQDLVAALDRRHDPSGNLRLGDVGTFLRDRLAEGVADMGGTVRYLDPSYAIRSLPANAYDAEFCLVLGQQAVHAAMSGRTDCVVGYWRHHFTLVPIPLVTSRSRTLDPYEDLWQRVLLSTRQPADLTRAA